MRRWEDIRRHEIDEGDRGEIGGKICIGSKYISNFPTLAARASSMLWKDSDFEPQPCSVSFRCLFLEHHFTVPESSNHVRQRPYAKMITE